MEQPQSCWQQNNNLVGTLEEALSWLRSRAEDVKANARELFLIRGTNQFLRLHNELWDKGGALAEDNVNFSPRFSPKRLRLNAEEYRKIKRPFPPLALMHPPWFADDEQQLGIAYFRNQGFEVVYVNQMRLRGLPVAQPTDPLRTFTELYPAELYAFARTQVPATADAVLFSGNGFRAIGVIAALEEDLGRPVLTANQVAFWYALRQAGVRAPVNGYGQVLWGPSWDEQGALVVKRPSAGYHLGMARREPYSSSTTRRTWLGSSSTSLHAHVWHGRPP